MMATNPCVTGVLLFKELPVDMEFALYHQLRRLIKTTSLQFVFCFFLDLFFSSPRGIVLFSWI